MTTKVKGNEAGKTVNATDLPKLTRVGSEAIVAMHPEVQFWVHILDDDAEHFDVLVIQWKDGTRLYLDYDAICTFNALCVATGAQEVLAMLHKQGNKLEGVYQVISA